ncbi:MAG TPA: hypothetical protein VGF25_05605 [Thermoleophilaceae bacterium]|jgi:hypothetical protein
MTRLDIRRLAAVDMYGTRGTTLRRRVIVAEFVLGAIVGTALGVLVAVTSSTLGGRLFGAWIAGACLNYVPLALHAVSLLGPGRLDAELAGVDIRAELRHYTKAQVWVAVPVLFLVLAPLQRRSRNRRATRG